MNASTHDIKLSVDYVTPLQEAIRSAVHDALIDDAVREAVEKIAIAMYAQAYDGKFDTPLYGSLASLYRDQARALLRQRLAQ